MRYDEQFSNGIEGRDCTPLADQRDRRNDQDVIDNPPLEPDDLSIGEDSPDGRLLGFNRSGRP